MKNLDDENKPIEIKDEVEFDLDQEQNSAVDENNSIDEGKGTNSNPDKDNQKEKDKDKKDGKNIVVDTEIGAGGDVHIGDKNDYSETKSFYYNQTFIQNSKNQEGQLFSITHLDRLDVKALQQETYDEFASFDSNKLKKYESILLEKRIILIYGEADLGKVFLSKKMATLLFEKNKVEKIFKSKNIYRNLNIDLSGFLKKETGVKNSIIIFNDFLEFNNNSIKQFFFSLRNVTIRNLLQLPLEQLNSYLIFTCNSDQCEEIIEAISETKILAEVELLSSELLFESFDKIKEKVFREIELKEELASTLKTFLSLNKDYIIDSLGKTGAIAALFKNIIHKAKRQREFEVNQEILQQEVNKLAGLTDWFSEKLNESEELWFWTISFTLCQCRPGNSGVSVSRFESIRREILIHLKNEKLIHNKNIESLILRTEGSFIEKCQAEVYSHFTTNEKYIRFQESNFKEKVWATLFKYNITSLIRFFSSIEKLADHKDYKIRNFVATIMGRLSEGFPDKTKDILKRWAKDSKRQQQVAYFFLGVWAVPNRKHKERFLNFLAQLAQTGGTPNQLRPHQYQEIHTAINGYLELAPYLLKSSLKIYGNILENRLGKQAEVINKLTAKLEQFSAKDINTIEDARKHNAHQQLGKLIIDLLFHEKKEDFSIAIHIQHAISHLCIKIDTATVFKELIKWILKGNKSLKILLTHLFLEDDGIADILNRFSIQINTDTPVKIKAKSHPVVYSLLTGEPAIKSTAAFINLIMDALNLLPLQYRRVYRKYLFIHLRQWVKNSMQLPIEFNPMVKLFVEMMLTSKEMENEIKFDMEYHFTQSKKELFEFKKAVQKVYFKKRM